MAHEEPTPSTSGVQDLIDRIRDDGVKSGEEEADRIIREAEKKAARIVAEAKAEAEETLASARARIESERQAAEESLKLAARDTIKELGEGVQKTFERQLKRLVGQELDDPEFLRQVILALSGKTASESLTSDRAVQILLGETFDGEEAADSGDEEAEERIRRFILGMSEHSLREGIELKIDSHLGKGVAIRIVDEDLKINLDDATISEFLVRHLLPRYRRILTGVDP